MDLTRALPSECIFKIISFTSPKDACRLSLISSAFKEFADSDDVWASFLPSNSRHMVAQSLSPHLNSLLNKQLYLHLSDHPLIFPVTNVSFSLEKETGRKCCTVGAKGLTIIWGDTPQYWKYISTPDSRFPQVAKLNLVWWFEIRGSFGTKLLSPRTAYDVFFVFKFESRNYGFTDRDVEMSVNYERSANVCHKRVILNSPGNGARRRQDGWMEIEMGDFFNETEEDDDNVLVEYKIWETNTDDYKKGLVVEGVEFRPKSIE